MRTWLLSLIVIISSSMQLVACAEDEEEDELPDVTCDATAPAFAEVAALKKCATCHAAALSGPARQNAPLDVNFDTEPTALAKAEKAAEEVNEGEMPPAASGISLTEVEKQQLYKWALCR